jgi:hypothetical protein
MNRQFPGRDLHPLVTCALVAHQYMVPAFFKLSDFYEPNIPPQKWHCLNKFGKKTTH